MIRLSLPLYAAREGMAGQPIRAVSEALSEGHRVELVTETGRALSESEAVAAVATGRPIVVILED